LLRNCKQQAYSFQALPIWGNYQLSHVLHYKAYKASGRQSTDAKGNQWKPASHVQRCIVDRTKAPVVLLGIVLAQLGGDKISH
jgi:hypothetical protein